MIRADSMLSSFFAQILTVSKTNNAVCYIDLMKGMSHLDIEYLQRSALRVNVGNTKQNDTSSVVIVEIYSF